MIVVNESHHAVGWTVAKLRPPGFSATFVAKGTYSLKPGAPALPVRPQPPLCGDVYDEDDPTRCLRYPSDFAPHKPRADLLLVGHAHAPGGKPTEVLRISFQVGKLAKNLAVIGDRIRSQKVVTRVNSPPAPFVTMPLDFAHAYGGAAFRPNPLGKGHAEETSPDGARIRRLPNVEHIDALMLDSDSAVDPAGFGPIPITWVQRLRKAGTYGKRWLKERWPWFAEDIDWSCFNAAPEDQQLKTYLRGDEKLRFENLHPKLPVLECSLPRLRVRCFYEPRISFHPKLREVQMNLDTLWACPEEDRLVLVWRGTTEISSDQLPERSILLLASEPLQDPPKPPADYETLLRARILDVAHKSPPLSIVPGPPKPPPPPKVEIKMEVPPEPTVPEEPLPPEIQAFLKKAPPPAPTPPPPDPKAVVAQLAAAGIAVPPIEPEPPEPPPPEPPPAPAEPKAPTREWCAARARKEGLAGLDLTGVDLSGLDLAGVSFKKSVLTRANLGAAKLAGADFSDAVLDGADLQRADLKKAVLANADLTSARMQNADLTEAVLEGADLSQAKLPRAVLVKVRGKGAILSLATLTDANLQGADLTAADLSRALLGRANLTEATLVEASLQGAVGGKTVADRADFTKVRAGGSNFGESRFRNLRGPGSIWVNAQLFRADFSGAELEGSHFSSAYLCQAKFPAADLKYARMDGANLRKADLVRIHFLRGSFQKANLTSADLREANLFQAEFFEAVTKDAVLQGANIKRTLLAMRT